MMIWDVEKRFSEFYNMHQAIAKRRKNLPKFPPKKLKRMKDHVILERQEALAKYMNELLLHFNIFADNDVCDFISMKDKDYMRTYFKSLHEYQETLMKGQKLSDFSDSGISEDSNKSPVKFP